MENQNMSSNQMMAQTPKYSKTKKIELNGGFDGTDMICKKEERLQSNSKKTQIFDQILKSLETPRVTSSNPYDLKGASRGKVRSRMGELKASRSRQNGIAGTKNLIINGSRMTNFSKLASNYSNFGSRVSSPSKKKFDFQEMKTPSIRSYRGNGMVFRDITNVNMPSKEEDLDMITSAMPERKSRGFMGNNQEFAEFSKSKDNNFFSQANDFSSRSQLKYLPKIPKIEFEEEEEEHQFANISSNFGRANVPKFDDGEFGAWRQEEKDKISAQDVYNKAMLIGKKRSPPDFQSYGLGGRKKVKMDMYSIAKNRNFCRKRSGTRSNMPERYKQEFEKPRVYDDFAFNSNFSQSESYSPYPDFEVERMKLKQRYEKESRMLMEKARKQKMVKKMRYNQMGDFKKPKSKKSKRGAARPPVIKEGDWLCPNQNCCNINWSKRVYCNLCHEKRPHMSAVKKRPYMVTKLYEANTWSCPKCKNIINAAHTFCGICGTTRTKDIEQGLEQVKRHYAQKKNPKGRPSQSPFKTKKEATEDSDNCYSSFSKDKEARAILDDPYNDGMLQLNLRRNFGPDYLASGNWYRSSEVKR